MLSSFSAHASRMTVNQTNHSENARSNRSSKVQFLLLIGLQFVTLSIQCIAGPILPDLMCIMQTDLKSASTMFSTYWMGQSCVCLLGVFLQDKVDVLRAMVVSLVLLAVLIAPVPSVTLLPVTDLLFFVIGGCCGVLKIGGYLQMGILSPKSSFGYHILAAGGAVGFVVTPLLASVFVHYDHGLKGTEGRNWTQELSPNMTSCKEFSTNIEYLFILVSLICLGFAIGLLRNDTDSVNDADNLQGKQKVSNVGKITWKYLIFKFLLLCLIGIVPLVQTSISSLFVTYAVRSNLKLNVTDATLLTSVFNISFLVSRFANSVVADRLRPERMFCIYLSLNVFTSAFFIIYKEADITTLTVVCVLFGIGLGPNLGCILAWSKSYVPFTIRFVSLYLIFVGVEGLCHLTITGVLMDLYGPDMFVYSISVICFLELLLFSAVLCLTLKMK